VTTRHSRIFFQRFARQHSIAPCSWFIVQERARGYTTLAVLNSQVARCGGVRVVPLLHARALGTTNTLWVCSSSFVRCSIDLGLRQEEQARVVSSAKKVQPAICRTTRRRVE